MRHGTNRTKLHKIVTSMKRLSLFWKNFWKRLPGMCLKEMTHVNTWKYLMNLAQMSKTTCRDEHLTKRKDCSRRDVST